MIEQAIKYMDKYSNNEIWDLVKNKLFNEFGETTYRHYILKLELLNAYNGILEFQTLMENSRDYIVDNYINAIKNYWNIYDNSINEVKVLISDRNNTNKVPSNDSIKALSVSQGPGVNDLKSSQKIWDLVTGQLRNEFGEATYKSWLSKLTFITAQNRILVLTVPTKFKREWINTNYAASILKFWKNYDSSIYNIEISVSNNEIEESAYNNSTEDINVDNATIEPTKTMTNSLDDVFSTILDKRFTFENFVVGTPNELAYAAARSVAESSKVQAEANPLFLYGGVGLGKTHLMHAVAWHIKNNNPTRKVIYISAEKFMYQFIKALRNQDVMAFKDLLRSVDVLMIDDVQFICGKDSTQAEFFHTLNALIDNNRQVIISADRSPSDLDGMEERIKSRLGWGLVADVHSTTYELRVGILMSKLEQMNTSIPNEVIEFLAKNITSNVRELEGALNKVVAHSTLVGRKISLENTQEILQDLLRSNNKVIVIDDIKKKAAERKNIKVSDLSSNSRERHIVRARQLAMYLSRMLTLKSLAEIGKNFGGRDHTTVMHAIKQTEDFMQKDPELAEDIKILTKSLQN